MTTVSMDINDIRSLIQDDMNAVDQLIIKSLHSDVALINQMGHYIVNSGGKRLRPMLVLLASRAMGYQGDQHILLAAVVEFIHTATLLHDDVVDESEQRRSKQTANAVWGNAASVLVGDFLYSRAFEMMVETQLMPVMDILSHATNRIAEGEVLQLLNCNDPETDEKKYREVILRKTATLFEAGAQLAGVLTCADETSMRAIANYGLHLGIAFQIIDDALDYSASSEDMGKNVGDDLAEGKPTLPLIRAMLQGNEKEKAIIHLAIEQGGLDQLDEILNIIQRTDAIDYTVNAAKDEADIAIQHLAFLPESTYKTALYSLAHLAVNRNH